MNLLELEEYLSDIVSFRPLATKAKGWINQAVFEIASDFELPSLRIRTPLVYHTSVSQFLYDLPISAPDAWVSGQSYALNDKVLAGSDTYICILAHTSGVLTQPPTGVNYLTVWKLLIEGTALYHKRMIKCRNSEMDLLSLYYDMHQIDSIDPFHDNTDTLVSSVAVEENQFEIYPMADDELEMWFYRRPVNMVNPGDSPDGVPPEYHRRVIIPKVALINFEIIQNFAIKPLFQNLQYWKDKYREGLYGDNAGDVGMINFFAKSRFHSRSGGRDPLP